MTKEKNASVGVLSMAQPGGPQTLMQVLVQVLGPIAMMVAIGYVLQDRLPMDTRSISRIVFYVLSPCLVYTTIISLQIDATTVWRMVAFAAINMILMALIAWLLTRRWGLSGGPASAFVVTAILLNQGNYGLPLNLFAFGQSGFQFALILYAFNTLVGTTLSIFLLAHGRHGAQLAFRRTVTAPIVWALLLGVLSRTTGRAPGGSFLEMLQLAGRSTIPVFLLILGMSLAQARATLDLRLVSRLTVLRMGVGPALAVMVATLLGLSGLAYSVAVMQASMPTAVNTIVLSNEFDAMPDFVSGAVLVTTLVSVVTLPVLLLWLGT